MTTAERPAYRVIGTRPVRPDGVEKVTGRALYGADIRPSGLLFGRVLRSPHAHAWIRRLDATAALQVPGVMAVVTHADLPGGEGVANLGEGGSISVSDLADNVLASRKALYRGHAVAAVAATSPHIAEEALKKIAVDYEVLPALIDVRDAMRPDAPLLDEKRFTKELAGARGEQPSNVAQHLQFAGGDVEAAFAAADFIIDREFTTSPVHQGYIEPHNATASWNMDGTVTVWTSTQGSFAVRAQLAEVLKYPIAKIRVIPLEIGGGFGGKIGVTVDPMAVLLSKKSGRPVKMTMSRAEVFEGSGPNLGTRIRVKAGFKGDQITAVQAELAYEAGAYPGAPVGAGLTRMLSPYQVPNFLLDGYDVCVNKPKNAAYRAPGVPAAAFAMEQVVDEAAERLGLDPLELRLRNASKEGTREVTGQALPIVGNIECLEAALNSPHYESPIEGPFRGRGVASGSWGNIGFQSTVVVGVNPDGSINLTEGSVDIGGTRASLSMQLAETLGVPLESIRPTVVDTDSVGYNDVTGGSRTTFATGMAVHEAGLDILRQMCKRAARDWNAPVEQVRAEDGGFVWDNGAEVQRKTFRDVAKRQAATGGPIVAESSLLARGAGPSFSTHIADVEVDPETGKVTVLRYTVVQDAGTAIHPAYVEGQMQGGAAQGIGWALNEEYCYDDEGRMLNASFLDYRMPTALDVPMIETVIVEVPNPGSPYGVRGVGEAGIIPPLAAIANAVHDATGKRFTDLPISPRRVLEALGE